MIELNAVSLAYNAGKPDAIHALDAVTLPFHPRSLTAIIGHNGSGKSTLARLIAALLMPTTGTITVDGLAATTETVWEIRRRVGIVFQKPDDQLVATTVTDDIAFGLENQGVPRPEMRDRVQAVLASLELLPLANAQISALSESQKQQVAIAGVLAVQPNYIILDEPTTMQSPAMTRHLLALAHRLRDEHGVGILHITHFMHEVADFDRIIVMHQGRVLMDGTPRAVFRHSDELRAVGLDVPLVTKVGRRLQSTVRDLPEVVLTPAELCAALTAQPPANAQKADHAPAAPEDPPEPRASTPPPPSPPLPLRLPLIDVRDLHFSYLAETPLERPALCGASCTIHTGEMVALLGGSQAGKSTLVEFFNGLRIPPPGCVFVDGQDVADPVFDRFALRFRVGMVFQQPESQLFEETVGKDVSFGPRTLGLAPAESRARVEQALTRTGLDYETFRNRYIYALSGGQKRRVAIAGVLAMQPDMLILDEPTAGLDPRGRDALVELVRELRRTPDMTILVIGSMVDQLAQEADRMLVMHAGKVVLEGTPRALLRQGAYLKQSGLELSEPAELALALRPALPSLRTDILTEDELVQAIIEQYGTAIEPAAT